MKAVRVLFRIATDVLVIAMLLSALGGCVGTPERYRNGDFVSHMASTFGGTAGEKREPQREAKRSERTFGSRVGVLLKRCSAQAVLGRGQEKNENAYAENSDGLQQRLSPRSIIGYRKRRPKGGQP